MPCATSRHGITARSQLVTLSANLLGMDIELLDRAACRGEDPEIFFTGSSRRAKQICAICPVRDACLEDALRVELFEHIGQLEEGRGGAIRNHGVYGGWTANERKPVIYRRAARMQAA